ncbi:protein LURP-one-related 14-like [Lycium ferocissimum]|uniref:protein LURP-one-related 14-like n=1 Tax=Lycium ferocissimum TaxID=112874 RepID=UPI0028151138|nr:protein LURP-one-related 14-like [Lycium ferocissimum]
MDKVPDQMAYGVPVAPLVSVVGDCFCVPYQIDLIVKKKIRGVTDAHIDVLDITGNLLFQLDGSLWQLNKKRIMRDPAGLRILTMREKAMTCRHRWTVHGGESSDASHMLYSVQRSNALQMKTRLDVFLPSNAIEDVPNFQVIGSYHSHSFKVYRDQTLLAEVNDNFKLGSFLWKGKESFQVRVYPGVDYAFIIALLVILNENDV